MQEIKKHVVDDTEYEFHHLNPFEAADLLTRILRKVLKPIGAALGNVKQAAGLLDADLNDMNIENAFMSISESMDKEVIQILKELLSSVRLGTGMEIVQDIHFKGRILHMVKVAFKSFEHNFSDFLAARSAAQEAVRRTLSQARATSTGSSGDQSSQGSQPLPKSMTAGR